MIKRNIIIITVLFFMSCSTSDIKVNNDALASIKVIALVPFYSSSAIDSAVYNESEEAFTSALTRLGYKVITLKSPSPEQSGTRFNRAEKSMNEIKTEAITSGADALLSGKIIFYEETTRIEFNRRPLFFGKFGIFDEDDKIERVTEFRFQIHITAVNLSDDAVILDIKNRYSSAEKDEYMPAFLSLEAYRKYTLEKMTGELMEKLSIPDRQ
jgi:hypothetical protein